MNPSRPLQVDLVWNVHLQSWYKDYKFFFNEYALNDCIKAWNNLKWHMGTEAYYSISSQKSMLSCHLIKGKLGFFNYIGHTVTLPKLVFQLLE